MKPTKQLLESLERSGIVLPGQVEQPKPGRNKYGAIRTEYKGVIYASKAEASRAKVLDEQQASGLIYWWIAHPKFRLGCPENVYIADALVVSPAGVRIEDVKGKETAKFKKDKRLWRAYGPCPLWIIKGGKVVEIIERTTEDI
jgi:hypothetical protein